MGIKVWVDMDNLYYDGPNTYTMYSTDKYTVYSWTNDTGATVNVKWDIRCKREVYNFHFQIYKNGTRAVELLQDTEDMKTYTLNISNVENGARLEFYLYHGNIGKTASLPTEYTEIKLI